MTTQNFAEKLAFLLHSEERAKSNLETHVYMVFQDGEICLTKCGNLLGQRSLHMVEAGVTNAIPSVFPNKMGENTYAYVGSKEEAMAIRLALIEQPESVLVKLASAINQNNEENAELKQDKAKASKKDFDEANKKLYASLDESTKEYLKDFFRAKQGNGFFDVTKACEKMGMSYHKARNIAKTMAKEFGMNFQ